MAETDPWLEDWMVLTIRVELDREYLLPELGDEMTKRIDAMMTNNTRRTYGVYAVTIKKVTEVEVEIRAHVRDAVWCGDKVTLLAVRQLVYTTLRDIARDVAGIDRIQSLRKLLPIEPTCTGM